MKKLKLQPIIELPSDQSISLIIHTYLNTKSFFTSFHDKSFTNTYTWTPPKPAKKIEFHQTPKHLTSNSQDNDPHPIQLQVQPY